MLRNVTMASTLVQLGLYPEDMQHSRQNFDCTFTVAILTFFYSILKMSLAILLSNKGMDIYGSSVARNCKQQMLLDL